LVNFAADERASGNCDLIVHNDGIRNLGKNKIAKMNVVTIQGACKHQWDVGANRDDHRPIPCWWRDLLSRWGLGQRGRLSGSILRETTGT
jgi:hypothetical protein